MEDFFNNFAQKNQLFTKLHQKLEKKRVGGEEKSRKSYAELYYLKIAVEHFLLPFFGKNALKIDGFKVKIHVS